MSARDQTITTNGVDLHVVEAGEPGAPLVVLAHGFPELAYSWRHQIPALAGGRLPRHRARPAGYGRSTGPTRSTTTTSST